MTSSPPLAIAIDLGGTQVRAAMFRANELVERAALPTDVSGGPDAVMEQMATLVEKVSTHQDLAECLGIGLSTAGPVDTQAGIILGIPTLPGWENYPVLHELNKRFGRPVYVENDAIASALGEWRHGAGQGLNNLVYITVSTGIGGGVVVDGRLLHGRRGMAAHVGHMRLLQEGPDRTTTSFEDIASGTALAKRADVASQKAGAHYLRKIANSKAVSAIDVFDGAKSGDEQCLLLVEEEAKYLGVGITTLIHIFSPERVIVGGGMAESFEMLQAGIQTTIQSDALEPFKQVPVVRAQLGGNAGLVGAATLVYDQANAKQM